MKTKLGQDKAKLRPQDELIIACDDMDLSWYPAEQAEVIRLWQRGCPLEDIAKKVQRKDMDEVTVFIIHLARKRKIKPRPGGVFGELRKVPPKVREMMFETYPEVM